MNKIIIITVLFILITYIICRIKNNKIEYFEQQNNKPIIWMYWENKPGHSKPAYLELCYKTVLKHCSNSFNIILLNEKTVYKYLPNLRKDLDKKLNIPQKTDYIRYLLLYNFGGIWLDSDIIVFNNLHPLIEKLKDHDYVGAGCHDQDCKNSGYPKPANWVMVSRSNTKFIKECLKECDNILDGADVNIKYFKLGRANMWKNIEEMRKQKWDYYHIDSKCLERDSDYNKITNQRLISNEDIDINCIDKLLYVPIYNTAPGFPTWFKNMNEEEMLNSDMLISKFFRKSLFFNNKYFENKKKVTIITPCYRTKNLKQIYNSIDFRYIDEWIIVYDGSKIKKKSKFIY